MRGLLFLLLCLLLVSCGKMSNKQAKSKQSSDSASVTVEGTIANKDSTPSFAKKIIEAYPEFNIKYSNNNLVFPDGTTILCDDGKDKSFTEKLDNCDIEDMFSMTYDVKVSQPAYLSDCGRGRCEALFKKMYGNNESAAREKLVYVDWFGEKIPFTKVNGAAEQLSKVASELSKQTQLSKYNTNASSFYWRKVRGANRQSAHSYGIAIDINTSFSNYWLWSNPNSSETDKLKYANLIPIEIVKAFEKNGFIWGGRWYHYDTMHFEYRPEFLLE